MLTKCPQGMVKAPAYSQLHYGERFFVSCQQENEREGVKLLACGSGALLLERKNVSLSTHSGCHRPLKSYVRSRSPFGEWCSCFCFSTCVCTNFNFLKTFFWSLTSCHIVYLLRELFARTLGNKRRQLFATEFAFGGWANSVVDRTTV